jgi:hypothetical protein
MIDTSQSTLHAVSVHRMGGSDNQRELILSKSSLAITDELLRKLLTSYFLANFNTPEYYSFKSSGGDLSTNPLFSYVSDIFNDKTTLHRQSIEIANHLQATSQHPNIKSGDLYIAVFSGVSIDNVLFDAVAIVKAENKDSFLKLQGMADPFSLSAEEGINIRKLDKACLVLDPQEDEEYRILLYDNTNKLEAQFWKDDFLRVVPQSDAFYHTNNFMNLTRQYIGDQLDGEFSVSKTDKIDLLNRSMKFFKSRDQFDQHEFESEVLGDASVIESFRNYERSLMTGDDIANNFEISAQAVKRQARVFKSVLKLDKNFHIYIHGNRDLIEKGFDPGTNRHFYKIYFDQET